MTLVISVFLVGAKKKIPLSREEKTQQTTSEKEKEKKNDKTNRRLTSSS